MIIQAKWRKEKRMAWICIEEDGEKKGEEEKQKEAAEVGSNDKW